MYDCAGHRSCILPATSRFGGLAVAGIWVLLEKMRVFERRKCGSRGDRGEEEEKGKFGGVFGETLEQELGFRENTRLVLSPPHLLSFFTYFISASEMLRWDSFIYHRIMGLGEVVIRILDNPTFAPGINDDSPHQPGTRSLPSLHIIQRKLISLQPYR